MRQIFRLDVLPVVAVLLFCVACGLPQHWKLAENEALTWSVVDGSGQPLDGVFVVKLGPRLRYSHEWSPVIEAELGLPRDPEAVRAAVQREVEAAEEYFELFQFHSNGEVFPFIASLAGITEDGELTHRLRWNRWKESEHSIGYGLVGTLFVVSKAGYRPVVVFAPDRTLSWLPETIEVQMDKDTARTAGLKNRPYVQENLTLQREVIDYWEHGQGGFWSVFRRNPFSRWEATLERMVIEARDAGNAADEAWLMLAAAGCPRLISGGYDAGGGDDDLKNGPVFLIQDRMHDVFPESPMIAAALDRWRFLRDSPIGLRTFGSASGLRYHLPHDRPWPTTMVQDLVQRTEQFEGRPLVALYHNDAGVTGLSFEKSDDADRAFYYRNRIRLWDAVLKEYPSSLWFPWYFDIMYRDQFREDTPYVLKYRNDYLARVD